MLSLLFFEKANLHFPVKFNCLGGSLRRDQQLAGHKLDLGRFGLSPPRLKIKALVHEVGQVGDGGHGGHVETDNFNLL